MTTGTATAEELALSAAGVNRAPSTFWQYPSEFFFTLLIYIKTNFYDIWFCFLNLFKSSSATEVVNPSNTTGHSSFYIFIYLFIVASILFYLRL